MKFIFFSYISGVTILGTPAEIYRFGTQYCIIAVAIWISGTVVATVYLPVFCKLQLYSSYEVKIHIHRSTSNKFKAVFAFSI